MAQDQPGTTKSSILLRVLAVALLVAAVLAAVSLATRERAARNAAAQVMKDLAPLLPAGGYDNHPDADRIFVRTPELSGADGRGVAIYRARLRGEPVAAVMVVVAPAGYVGPITLLVSLAADGRIIGVRALTHRETPGLGDRIDTAKSDWIGRFAGRSLEDPPPDGWSVRHDGGAFDEITGATITSRAVVAAVRNAALYFRDHRDEIFRRPAE